jgi:hypothetical protein
MSTGKMELVEQAMAALLELPDDENYAKGVLALFQLSSIAGEKWLNELNIHPAPGEFLDREEVLKLRNENINNVFQMMSSADILKLELQSATVMPPRFKQLFKVIYHAFYMGMAFGYLNPDFVLKNDLIVRGLENKATRQKVQSETVAKMTVWHPAAKDAYYAVRERFPHLKSAVKIRDIINAHYQIPGMTPGALYDLVLQWQKEADKKEPIT